MAQEQRCCPVCGEWINLSGKVCGDASKQLWICSYCLHLGFVCEDCEAQNKTAKPKGKDVCVICSEDYDIEKERRNKMVF